jgi:hypothetical protein
VREREARHHARVAAFIAKMDRKTEAEAQATIPLGTTAANVVDTNAAWRIFIVCFTFKRFSRKISIKNSSE